MSEKVYPFPYDIEDWPLPPLKTRRSQLRRETKMLLSKEISICLLGNPYFAARLLNWMQDASEDLILQIWLQNCSDQELLLDSYQQIEQYAQSIQTSEPPSHSYSTLQNDAQVKGMSKIESNADLSSEAKSEHYITAKLVLELKEQASVDSEQWERDLNNLLVLCEQQGSWMPSAGFTSDQVEHFFLEFSSDLERQLHNDCADDQTLSSSREDFIELAENLSKQIWQYGKILETAQHFDEDVEFKSQQIYDMFYHLSQNPQPTAVVISLNFLWQDRKIPSRPRIYRDMPPHYRHGMRRHYRKQVAAAHIPERKIKRRVVVVSQGPISSLLCQSTFRSLVGQGQIFGCWHTLADEEILKVMEGPAHLFNLGDLFYDEVEFEELLSSMTTTAGRNRRRSRGPRGSSGDIPF